MNIEENQNALQQEVLETYITDVTEEQLSAEDNSCGVDEEKPQENVTEDETSKTDDNWGSKFSIYDYFKNHTTMLIAAVSAFVAFYTFCAYMSDYTVKTYTLQQMNLSAALYRPNEKSILMSFVLSCIPFVIYGLIFFLYFYVFTSYFSNMQFVRYSSIQLSDKKREYFNDKKDLEKLKRLTKKGESKIRKQHRKGILTPKEYVEAIHDASEYLKKRKESDLRLGESEKELRKHYWECRWFYIRTSGFKELILPTLLCWIYVFITSNDSIASVFINKYVYTTIVVFVFIALAIIGAKVISNTRVDKKSILSDKNGELHDKLHHQEIRSSFLHQLLKKGIRQFLPNIVIVLLAIEITVAVLIMAFLPNGIIAVANAHSLPLKAVMSSSNVTIVTIDDSKYVVAHQDGTQFYLEEAKITEEKTLIVNTNKILFMDASELHAETMTFEEVILQKGD